MGGAFYNEIDPHAAAWLRELIARPVYFASSIQEHDMTTILADRLEKVKSLSSGAHPQNDAQMCAMEAAAYIAGEPWSDHPECVCPVIAAFARAWNDSLPDAERNALLLPLIPKTVGTRGSEELAHRRALMAADWLVRVNTPAWLRLAGLTIHADALAALPEITSMAQVPSIRGAIEAARDDAAAAWAAAWDAARAAAWAAAWDAARAAAWDAAWAAAWDAARAAARYAAWAAAWDAAWDAAWAAARAAAWAAAWAAARAAARAAGYDAALARLAPVKAELQASAAQIIERMCALTEDDLQKAA